MAQGTCVIGECDRTALRRGWYRPDATRGCSIEDCEREHYGRGWCVLHWTRWKKTGDPLVLRPHFSPLAGRVGDLNPAWVGDRAGYEAVHGRLRKYQGPANMHSCMHCGNQAEQWAYDHEDPDQRVSPSGLAYSVKGGLHYVPLCVSCHKAFDLAAAGYR